MLRKSFGMIVLIFAITGTVVILDALVERFLTKKESNNFKIISNNIAKNILDMEKQAEERLKVSTLFLEKYLQENPLKGNPVLDMENLINFTKLANVDRATLHSLNGKKVLGSSTPLLIDPEIIEKMKTYNLLDRVVNPQEFLSMDHNVVIFPMGRDTVTGATSKPILRFSEKLNMIMSCAMEVSVSDVIKTDITLHPDLTYISLSTPSGILFADSRDSVNTKLSPVNEHSDDIQIIENSNNSVKLQLCFGGLQKENAIRIIDKTVNSKNQYFYVLTTEFSKKDINKQIFSTRVIFGVISVLIFGILFFIKDYKMSF